MGFLDNVWDFMSGFPMHPLWGFLLLFSVIVFIGYWLASRLEEEECKDLSDSANKLLGATATGLFVLIGFCISMLWSILNDELAAVDDHVIVASELAWTSQQLDATANEQITEALVTYLNAVAFDDRQAYEDEAFTKGNTTPYPSDSALQNLQQEVDDPENYTKDQTTIQQTLSQQVTKLAGTRESIRAIANRVLPYQTMVVLIVAAAVVALFAGASMASHRRPYLVIGWVLSSTLALTLVFWLNNPFTGPIEVDFTSIAGLADRLQANTEFANSANN